MRVAREETIPICQDTGMAVIFMTIGQDVHFVGGSLNEAINKGVARVLYRGQTALFHSIRPIGKSKHRG